MDDWYSRITAVEGNGAITVDSHIFHGYNLFTKGKYSMEERYSEEQKDLIQAVNGPVICIACPGSGKTTALLQRVRHMQEIGISPESMLITTFTEAAKNEMQNRYEAMGLAGAKIKTIHGFCMEVIKDYISYDKIISLKPFLRYYIDQAVNNTDKYFYFTLTKKNEPRKYHFHQKWHYARKMAENLESWYDSIVLELSHIRLSGLDPMIFQSKVDGVSLYQGLYQDLLTQYESFKQEHRVIDFDDMLIYAKKRLMESRETLSYFQEQYRYIMIDEFQDTNKIQAEIFYLLAERYSNICVVGDDDQSIYGFCHADSSIMLAFPEKFPSCRKIRLSTNYRCAKSIVNSSVKLISNNTVRFNKRIQAYRNELGKLQWKQFDSGIIQARVITESIKFHLQTGMRPEEISVIYRNSNSGLPFINELTRHKIPFYCTSQIENVHEKEIFRDIQAYYHVSRTGADSDSRCVKRVLCRPLKYLKLSDYNCRFIKNEMLKGCSKAANPAYAHEHVSALFEDVEALKEIDNPVEFMDRLKTVRGADKTYYNWLFLEFIKKYEGKKEIGELKQEWDTLYEEAMQFESMKEWFQYVAHYKEELEIARVKKEQVGVCLTTMHGSKGLEWKCVYIVDAADKITPNAYAKEKSELEEERRMFYVAVTRAKDFLYISMSVGEEAHQSEFTPYLSELFS